MRERKWILIVDDDDDIREMMIEIVQEHISDMNIKAIGAKDGKEAEQKLVHQVFDLIITDLRMPRLSGAGFIDAAEKSELNANTPIMIVTGFPSSESTQTRPHVIMFHKPFDKDNFIKAVRSQIQLGRIDSRIPAHLLNPFLEALHSYSTQYLKKPALQKKAVIKKPGQTMPGDIFCVLQVQVGHIKSVMVIAYDKAVAQRLQELPGRSSSVLETVRNSCEEVFKLMSAIIFSHDGHKPDLLGVDISEGKGGGFFEDLKNGKGLIIPLEIESGKIYVEAIAPKKINRISISQVA